jgi:hypothetical protein
LYAVFVFAVQRAYRLCAAAFFTVSFSVIRLPPLAAVHQPAKP